MCANNLAGLIARFTGVTIMTRHTATMLAVGEFPSASNLTIAMVHNSLWPISKIDPPSAFPAFRRALVATRKHCPTWLVALVLVVDIDKTF